MFPLQSVLFPRAALPLQVFEPRYLRMIDEVLDGDRRFGVVLIARGNEVGGGDERERVGTVARIVRVGALDDGRLTLVALGERRLRVVDWLEDDPYPVATITELEPDGTGPGTEAMVDRARRAYRRTLAIASELGGTTADPEPELPESPLDATWFLCDAAPLEQYDRQRLLEIDGVDLRLEELIGGLDARSDLLRDRLARG
jgi:Lon protease-like protein